MRVLTLWRAAVGECGANVMRADPLTFLEVCRHLRADCLLGVLYCKENYKCQVVIQEESRVRR